MGTDADELLEVVDSKGVFLRLASRRECHSDPSLIHRSVCVLVYDAEGRIFLQKRSARKDLYAGMWDLSATGHARAGESDEEAAARELREELGIEAPLHPLGRLLVRQAEETELSAMFACVHPGELHPNPSEIDGGEYLDLALVRRRTDLTPYALSILDHVTDTLPGDLNYVHHR
ncbi:MAG: NUDIX domain-containing protein [Chloroflexota bacterium]|nr:NUDIX domain-containing protein [Chloroflexota bacterium]